MFRYSCPFAICTDPTDAAFGGNRDADILAVSDEEVVDGKPILLRKFFAECKFSLVRILRFDIPPAVGNPMNVCIYTNTWFAIPKSYH